LISRSRLKKPMRINTPDQDFQIGPWWEWSMRLVVIRALILRRSRARPSG